MSGRKIAMPTSTPTTIDYTDLSDSIELFSKISQINTSFYALNDTLLKEGTVYHGANDIQHNLSLKDATAISLFPVIANQSIYGFVICDATSVSQERVNLSQTYIESIANNTLGRMLNTHIQILNPLSAQSVAQMRRFALLFKPTLSQIDHQVARKHNQTTHAGNTSSIGNVLGYVQSNIKNSLSLESVSQNVFLSPSYLSRIFKKYLHVNFIDYVNCQKMAIACEHLMMTNEKVSVIARQVGCSQNSYFSKVFKNITQMTPLEYRRNHYVVQKIYTIPHDLTWGDHDTVFDVSRRYFKKLGINLSIQTVDGYPYVNQIGDLTDSGDRGWVYTVDCRQPTHSASAVVSSHSSVIQWIYTTRF
ncbi:transcriptional regulator, AraC family [Levilactobacillus zymae DSM 19395]|nr:transcriptional regulator, AraC family [Levilactobacillus zymae DSM 19395]